MTRRSLGRETRVSLIGEARYESIKSRARKLNGSTSGVSRTLERCTVAAIGIERVTFLHPRGYL